MEFSKYLDLDTMHKLVAGIQASVAPEQLEVTRNELLQGITPSFIAHLPANGNALNKIKSDLNTINTIPFLLGYEVPLQLWLTNAVQLLRATHRPQTSYFQQILEVVAAQSQKLIAEDKGQPGDPVGYDEEERIVHKDDMLSYGWLAGALATGLSVARLTVKRHEEGYPTGNKYYGTGWLIGQQYLMTNHHVINARSSGENAASEADLRLQATSMEISFDYDAPGLVGQLVEAAELCAWGSSYHEPALDYAVIKLTEPISDRKSLILAPLALQNVEQILNRGTVDKPPVNIIQHPGGRPKMLGVRNNQIHQITDTELSYFTDTEGGSSGSPVCNDDWQVIALHRRWKKFYERNVIFQGKESAWENRGTRIDRIIDDLRQNHEALWQEINARLI
ncbi:MAG: trypsin-like peptidase domain-containing protein [Ardenticatenaceae bacterium]|nr:trypsin-like peptidase domain-containing protein [Ardenticatenaceae bacterium]